MQIARKEQKGMQVDYSILCHIVLVNKLRDKIRILDTESGPIVCGKSENLTMFVELLRKEAEAAEKRI